MKCIIIEDQPPAQRILQKYITDLGTLELVSTFNNAINALDFLKNNEVDLIFLDIHLPKLSGIDFLKTIENPPHVILTTAFPDFALESYELNVVDYLLKPFSFARFIKAVSKITPHKQLESTAQSLVNSIFIKSGHEYHKVLIEDIIIIHSDRDYTELHTIKSKYLSNNSLKYWEDILAIYKFIRVHKSYLINESRISKITASEVELNNGKIIPIGRAYKKNLDRIIDKN